MPNDNRHSWKYVPFRDQRDPWVVYADLLGTDDPKKTAIVRKTVQSLDAAVRRHAHALARTPPDKPDYETQIKALRRLHRLFLRWLDTLHHLEFWEENFEQVRKLEADREAAERWSAESESAAPPLRDQRDPWVVYADLLGTDDPKKTAIVRKTVQSLDAAVRRHAHALARTPPDKPDYETQIKALRRLHRLFLRWLDTLHHLERWEENFEQVRKLEADREAAERWSAESESAAWARREAARLTARDRAARR